MPTTTSLPDISRYTECCLYLRDAYTVRKKDDKKFSHRYINRKVGVQSSGWFADIIAGRQKVKPRHASPLAAIFKLDSREREFLRVLIEMEQACVPEEKTAAYEKWFELKGVRQEKIARDKFKYFERWYYPVMRELLGLKASPRNAANLASQLCPPISPRQAKDAVQTLTRLGVLLPGAPAPQPVLVKDSSTRTPHWHKILQAYQELSIPALHRFKQEERNFSALTLPLSPAGLKKAGEEVASLRRRLLMLSEKDRGRNRVYQCLFQVFPVTQPVEVLSG